MCVYMKEMKQSKAIAIINRLIMIPELEILPLFLDN